MLKKIITSVVLLAFLSPGFSYANTYEGGSVGSITNIATPNPDSSFDASYENFKREFTWVLVGQERAQEKLNKSSFWLLERADIDGAVRKEFHQIIELLQGMQKEIERMKQEDAILGVRGIFSSTEMDLLVLAYHLYITFCDDDFSEMQPFLDSDIKDRLEIIRREEIRKKTKEVNMLGRDLLLYVQDQIEDKYEMNRIKAVALLDVLADGLKNSENSYYMNDGVVITDEGILKTVKMLLNNDYYLMCKDEVLRESSPKFSPSAIAGAFFAEGDKKAREIFPPYARFRSQSGYAQVVEIVGLALFAYGSYKYLLRAPDSISPTGDTNQLPGGAPQVPLNGAPADAPNVPFGGPKGGIKSIMPAGVLPADTGVVAALGLRVLRPGQNDVSPEASAAVSDNLGSAADEAEPSSPLLFSPRRPRSFREQVARIIRMNRAHSGERLDEFVDRENLEDDIAMVEEFIARAQGKGGIARIAGELGFAEGKVRKIYDAATDTEWGLDALLPDGSTEALDSLSAADSDSDIADASDSLSAADSDGDIADASDSLSAADSDGDISDAESTISDPESLPEYEPSGVLTNPGRDGVLEGMADEVVEINRRFVEVRPDEVERGEVLDAIATLRGFIAMVDEFGQNRVAWAMKCPKSKIKKIYKAAKRRESKLTKLIS